jgi:proteasome component ECM29
LIFTLDYLSFHADKYNISQEHLENTRLQATKTSPMMAAIERCMDQVDEEILVTLVPRLCSIIRKGVGLPTKAGCARIVCSLCSKYTSEMDLHASALMKALSGVIQDRSIVLRKAVATAIGHVARLVSQNTLLQFIRHNKKFYLDSGDEDERQITAIAFKEIARYAPDKMKSVMGEVLPIAFLGIHDSVEGLQALWSSVWDELAAGSKSASRLWIPEILTLCEQLMKDSQSWKIKRQVAKCISAVAQAGGASFDDFRESSFKILIDSVSGRTWEGKEDVVESLSTLAIESNTWLANHQALKDEITAVFCREATKNAKSYKRVAIDCLGKVVLEFKVDVYDRVEQYLMEYCMESNDMDVDDVRDKPLSLSIQAGSYKALGKCFSAGTRSYGNLLFYLMIQISGTKRYIILQKLYSIMRGIFDLLF